MTLPGFDITSASEGSQSLLIRLGQGQPVTGVVQAGLRFVAVMPERITLPISHEYPDPDTGDSFSATQNTSISGNILLTDGATFDTEGFDVTVNGDFILDGGTLRLNGGTLRITGDLRIQGFRREESTIEVRGTSSGRIIMNDGDDHLIVEGDFYMNSTKEHRGSLSEGNGQLRRGILEVRGHFRQDSSGDSRNFSAIDGGAGFRTILKGSLKTVILESAQAGFDILEPQNQTLFVEPDGSLSNQIPSHNTCEVSSGSWSLSQDIAIQGDLHLNGGNLNFYGGTLIITGSLIQSGGRLQLQGGRLEVGGDYLIQRDSNDDGVTDASSYGRLYMTNPADYILVEGDFVMDSVYAHRPISFQTTADLSQGVLEVRGDFTQLSTDNANRSDQNFPAGENHRVILSGSSTQSVSFEDSASYFRTLEITNPVGVSFSPSLQVYSLVGTNDTVTLNEPMFIEQRSFTPTEGITYNIPGVIHKGNSLSLNSSQTLTIDGDYFFEDGSLNLYGGTLIITGSLIQSGGNLALQGGRLEVGGDYLIQRDSDDDGVTDASSYGRLYMNNPADYILVEGDFVMDSVYAHRPISFQTTADLSQGVLEVRGDFTQLSTDNATRSEQNFPAGENQGV